MAIAQTPKGGRASRTGESLFEAGQLEEARAALEKAVAMDKKDTLAAKNLNVCVNHMKARTSRRKK